MGHITFEGGYFVAKLLQTLYEHQLKSHADGSAERTLVSLHLENGPPVEGWLLDYGSRFTDENQPMVMLFPSDASKGSMIGTPLNNVSAVTVIKAPEPAQQSPVTRGDVNKASYEISQLLGMIIGNDIPSEVDLGGLPDNAYAIGVKQLRSLGYVLMQLFAYVAAHQAFKTKVFSLKIRFSNEMSASLEDYTLSITLPLESLSLPDLTALITSTLA